MDMTHLKNLLWKGQHGIQFFMEMCKYWIIFPFAWIKYHNKNVWVISERGTDARDNGYHFFCYIKEKHPEQEVYFILDKSSIDYRKIAKYGNVIQYHSIKHYMIYIGAKIKISTHTCGCSPKQWWYFKLEKRKLVPGYFVFLQHGITKDNIVLLHKKNTSIDLFICGAKPEYKYVLKTFGYNMNQVKYTGFARYDNLQNFQVKRQILVMPTWRKELSYMTECQIKNSEYVKRWNGFLQNKYLLDELNKRKVELIFYPHYEMQKYLYMFTGGSVNIKIASFENYDVQQLLKESILLVTDYSSVYFDFAYMQKPVIYYQFDRENYRKNHYKEGYFDYDTMGFGPVTLEENRVVQEVTDCIKNDCQISKTYQERIGKFFVHHDQRNCHRIYNEICKLGGSIWLKK